jgi:20S proteasome subunit alpha 6
MFRNQYDNDVTVFSPQGRLFQVEYALEAVKQGAPCVGIISDRHAVVAGLKRTSGDLSASAAKKLFSLAPHVGCAIAGLTSDARVLTRSMQKAAQGELMNIERKVPVVRLVEDVAAERAQHSTQYYGGRPFGVGLLIAGVDGSGPHLVEFSPSGTIHEYTAWAIGARAQSARTYFEGHFDSLDASGAVNSNPFAACTVEQLVQHALIALRECMPPEQALSIGNTSVGVVSVDADFRVYGDAEVASALSALPALMPRGGSRNDEEMPPASSSATTNVETI